MTSPCRTSSGEGPGGGVVSFPDPALPRSLVTVERFLGCPDSAVLVFGKPIRSLCVTVARDLMTCNDRAMAGGYRAHATWGVCACDSSDCC